MPPCGAPFLRFWFTSSYPGCADRHPGRPLVSRRLRQRWPALLPTFSALLLWRRVYRGLGYGARGSAYADPCKIPFITFRQR